MISQANWRKYISRLAAIDKKAADLMQKWIEQNGLKDGEALVQYAYALVTKYGETSATLASEMYDYMAELMDADIPPAVPAETATLKEVAKGVTWGKYHSPSQIPSVVSRQVRQAGADTMIQNAKRDHAQWAWVPQGDTCAFCITLASRGWQDASKTVLKGNHAEHIHQKCDCTFAIAFKPSDKKQYDAVYDPDKYLDMYMNASDGDSDDKIKAIRRQIYQKYKDEINAQKRDLYQIREKYLGLNKTLPNNDISDSVKREDNAVIKRYQKDFKGNVPAKLVSGEKSYCQVFKQIDEQHWRIEREIVNTELPSGSTNVDIGNPAYANSIHERMHDIVNQILIKRTGLADGLTINSEQMYLYEREKAIFIQNAFIECFGEFDDADMIYKTIESEISVRAMKPIEMFPEAAVQYIGIKDYSVYAERLYNYVIREWKK